MNLAQCGCFNNVAFHVFVHLCVYMQIVTMCSCSQRSSLSSRRVFFTCRIVGSETKSSLSFMQKDLDIYCVAVDAFGTHCKVWDEQIKTIPQSNKSNCDKDPIWQYAVFLFFSALGMFSMQLQTVHVDNTQRKPEGIF